MLCPYCARDTPHVGPSEDTVWLDLVAKGAAFSRTWLELRASGATIKEVARGMLDQEPPELEGVARSRLCPFCRHTHMTSLSPDTLVVDFGVRMLGFGRSLVRARGNGFRGVMKALVDGDDAAIKPKTARPSQSKTAEGARPVSPDEVLEPRARPPGGDRTSRWQRWKSNRESERPVGVSRETGSGGEGRH